MTTTSAGFEVEKGELLAKIFRDLNLRERVFELLVSREWPTDEALIATLCTVVALEAVHCGRTLIRTPQTARFCGDAWVGDHPREAAQIFVAMQLDSLLDGLEREQPE